MPRKVQKRPAPSKESSVSGTKGQPKKKTKKAEEVDSVEDRSNDPEKRVVDEDTNEDDDTLPDVTGAKNTGEEKEEEGQLDIEGEDATSSASPNGNSLSMSKTSKSVGGKKNSGAGAAGVKKKATEGGKKAAGKKPVVGKKAAALAAAGGDKDAAKAAADVVRAAAKVATTNAENKDPSAVPLTAEILLLKRKLLALQKEDLAEALLSCVYFGKAPTFASLEKDLPKPNMKIYTDEMRKALQAVYGAMPYSKYGHGNHYCFMRCKGTLDHFAEIVSKQTTTLINLENWEGALEYALEAGSIVNEMPHWNEDRDNRHQRQSMAQLTGLLVCAIPKLSLTSGRAKALVKQINDKRLTDSLKAVVTILEAKV